VPSEWPTINAALDAALPGDSVLVAPGLYADHEARDVVVHGALFDIVSCAFLRDGVVLASEAGPEATIIEMGPGGTVVFAGDLTSDLTTVEGFTVSGNSPGTVGIDAVYSHLTVRNCTMKDLKGDFGPGAHRALPPQGARRIRQEGSLHPRDRGLHARLAPLGIPRPPPREDRSR
jgi:hypothetical protein